MIIYSKLSLLCYSILKDNKEHKDNSPHKFIMPHPEKWGSINYLWPRHFLIPASFAHCACTFSTVQVDTTPPDVLKGCGSDLSNMLMSIIILCGALLALYSVYRWTIGTFWLPWQSLWSSIKPTGLPMLPIKSGKDVALKALHQCLPLETTGKKQKWQVHQ